MQRENREERHSYRQRGAGARELKTASFGFSFGTTLTQASPVAAGPVSGRRTQSASGEPPESGAVECTQPLQKTKAKAQSTATRRTRVAATKNESDTLEDASKPRRRGRPRKEETRIKVDEEPLDVLLEQVDVLVEDVTEVPCQTRRARAEKIRQSGGAMLSKPSRKRPGKALTTGAARAELQQDDLAVVQEVTEGTIVLESPAPKMPRKRKKTTLAMEDGAATSAILAQASAPNIGELEQTPSKKRKRSGRPRKEIVSFAVEVTGCASKEPRGLPSDHDCVNLAIDSGRSPTVELVTTEVSLKKRQSKAFTKRRHDHTTMTMPASSEQSVVTRVDSKWAPADLTQPVIERPLASKVRPQQKKKAMEKCPREETKAPMESTGTSPPSPISGYKATSLRGQVISHSDEIARKQRQERPRTVMPARVRSKPVQEARAHLPRAKAQNERPVLMERSTNPQPQGDAAARPKRRQKDDDDEGGLGAILNSYGGPRIPSTLAMASDSRLKFRF